MREAFGTWPGSAHARREWWYGAPGDEPGWVPTDIEVLDGVAIARRAGRVPRFWIAEPATAFWCRDLGIAGPMLDGRFKLPHEMPETLTSPGTTSEAIRERIQLLLDAGVPKGTGFAVAPYTFGLANREWWVTPELEDNLPSLYPRGYRWRQGAPDPYEPGLYLDYPDLHVITRDAVCLDWWLYALRGQHPEIGHVIVQASNCSGAYGWRGEGYDMYSHAARLLAKHGYPVRLQIEGANIELAGGDCATPYADCRALRAIERATPRPRISIFWGPTWAEIADELEACA